MTKRKNSPLYILIFLLVFSCSKSESNDTGTEMPPLPISVPTLTTTAISEITQNTAISGGNITEDGNANVTARGVCWSTSTNPTTSDNTSSDGSGEGEFSSSITGLEANTTYFLRSYATNSEGTAYGSEFSFETLEPEPVAKVFEGDVILTSQKEVDDFGVQIYTEITGSLIVQDVNTPATIQDLKPLINLTTIGGDLFINKNNILTTIDGFSGLKNIGNDLAIISNDSLESINTYENLEFIGGSLRLSKLKGVINSFRSLRTIGSKLTIQFANGIDDLTFFESLENINGPVELFFNEQLSSLQGFNLLSSFKSLRLWANNSLSSLSGLNNIESIDEDLIIQTNGSLESLEGLEMLKRISNGNLEILNNTALKSLSGINNLKSIGSRLTINGNSAIQNLEGLENLEATGVGTTCVICIGSITLELNEKLMNVDALENLTTAWYGSIDIKNNLTLENLDGLRNLVNIFKFPSDSGGLIAEIEGNTNLNDICGLKTLLDSNSSRYFLGGNFNGTDINPEGNAQALLSECD